jgi:large subunit ribosomal protein L6
MSRIGSRLISIPDGVTVSQDGQHLEFNGPKGSLSLMVPSRLTITLEDKTIAITRSGNDRIIRSLHGLTRVLVANCVTGVSTGFTKKLEMQGIGYRAQTDGSKLTLHVGFTHPIVITAPSGINFGVEKNTIISITGIDKQSVGQVAANIRSMRKPEPYKGKGIRYEGELVRRKAGKAAKAGK